MGELRVFQKRSLTRLFFFACSKIEQVLQNAAASRRFGRAEKDTQNFFSNLFLSELNQSSRQSRG
jgi:hypothetical protein